MNAGAPTGFTQTPVASIPLAYHECRMRAQIRNVLFSFAIIGAVFTGAASVSALGSWIKAPPARWPLLTLGACLAVVAACMAIRAALPLPLHNERRAARAAASIDWALLFSFWLTSLVTFAGITAFYWPGWVIAAVAGGMLGIAALVLARRFNRISLERDGLCPVCAYDVRGLPEPRCPECGTRLTDPSPPGERDA